MKQDMKDELHMGKEEFKDLCTEILPMIAGIMSAAKKMGIEKMLSLAMQGDGYITFSVHDSRWEMVRINEDSPVRIKHEYSEVIKISDANPKKAVFGYSTENIIEIALVYADMLECDDRLNEIDSVTWKQKFVDWANEFEEVWEDAEDKDYLEEIEKFARRKIAEYCEIGGATK